MPRSVCLAASIVMFSAAAALAGCYDSPTWKAAPLTQTYIESESKSGASRERVALLEVLRRTEEVASQRRAANAHRLIPVALQRYDGDRSALRKKMKNGDLTDLVPLLNIEIPDHRTFRPQLVELLWLNGCIEEALDVHSRDPSPYQLYDLLHFAIGDTETLRKLAGENETAGYRYGSLAMLQDNPQQASAILSAHIARLDTFLTDEVKPEDQFERFGVESLLAALENRPLPRQPEDFLKYRYAYLALWFSALGACKPIEHLIQDLNNQPPGRGDHWRTALDVATLRCELHQG